MIRLIVFDFDGLILDTEVPDFEGWREIFRDHGCRLSLPEWAPCVGTAPGAFDPCARLEALLGRPVDRDALRRAHRARYAERLATQPLLPGVTDYIAAARRLGLTLGLASSSARAWVTGHLARFGLEDAFDCVKCADDVLRAKPEPDLYDAVLAATGRAAAEAVALEDSPNGILAAKRAGLYCVAVPNPVTRALPLEGADLRLASLADVPLEELLPRLKPEPA